MANQTDRTFAEFRAWSYAGPGGSLEIMSNAPGWVREVADFSLSGPDDVDEEELIDIFVIRFADGVLTLYCPWGSEAFADEWDFEADD